MGTLVGLLGIGGGVVLVPAMVYLLALRPAPRSGYVPVHSSAAYWTGGAAQYWKNGHVDLRAGIYCAVGLSPRRLLGGRIAVPMASRDLQGIFGFFLVCPRCCCGEKRSLAKPPERLTRNIMPAELRGHWDFCGRAFCGVAAGMVGIGGGVLLVPLLGLLFGFSQHRAQGTSLVALIPPQGCWHFWRTRKRVTFRRTGLLLIPGVFLGGILGSVGAPAESCADAPGVCGADVSAGHLAGLLCVATPDAYLRAHGRPSLSYSFRGSMTAQKPLKRLSAMAEDAIADGITHVVATPHASSEHTFDFANVSRPCGMRCGKTGGTD